VAAKVGIDWADQKDDVVLRSVDDPPKAQPDLLNAEVNSAQIAVTFHGGGRSIAG